MGNAARHTAPDAVVRAAMRLHAAQADVNAFFSTASRADVQPLTATIEESHPMLEALFRRAGIRAHRVVAGDHGTCFLRLRATRRAARPRGSSISELTSLCDAAMRETLTDGGPDYLGAFHQRRVEFAGRLIGMLTAPRSGRADVWRIRRARGVRVRHS